MLVVSAPAVDGGRVVTCAPEARGYTSRMGVSSAGGDEMMYAPQEIEWRGEWWTLDGCASTPRCRSDVVRYINQMTGLHTHFYVDTVQHLAVQAPEWERVREGL